MVIQPSGNMKDQTTFLSPDDMLNQGEGTVFKGAPNTGVVGGPAHSPQLPAALAEV